MSWPWSELGLEGPAELPAIRRAYAQRLKTTHPEEDPEGFQRLHDAYQEASRRARQRKRVSPLRETEEEAISHREVQETEDEEPLPRYEACDTEETAPPPHQEARDAGEAEAASGESGTGRESADWDYDRLFAEGEEEAREARRRHLEELRQKNRARRAAREAEQRKRAGDDEEAWEAVMAAAHALELLRSINAPLSEWRRFLKGPVFWSARANLDFIFALEDFLEQDPDLPKEVRQAIFSAYGFEKGAGKPEYKRLYRLLNVSGKEKRRLRREKSVWRRQFRSWPRRRQFATVFGIVFLGLMAVIGFWDPVVKTGAAVKGLFSSKPAWQETAPEWLEEDFGCRFVYAGDENDPHIFAPEVYPDRLFFAYPDGKRDLESGSRGYQTNYPDRMVMGEMENFAREEGLDLDFDSAGDGYQGRPGETPGAYLLQMPLLGAEESITRLEERMTWLRRQPWYIAGSPDFEVFLCYGDLSFYKVRSTEGEFDGDYARSVYENKFGPEMCRYITEASGTAARNMGEDAYVLLEEGTVTIDGETFFWVSGRAKPPANELLYYYFLSADGGELFGVPAERFSRELTQADLRNGGRTDHLITELGDRSKVTVWDLGAVR